MASGVFQNFHVLLVTINWHQDNSRVCVKTILKPQQSKARQPHVFIVCASLYIVIVYPCMVATPQYVLLHLSPCSPQRSPRFVPPHSPSLYHCTPQSSISPYTWPLHARLLITRQDTQHQGAGLISSPKTQGCHHDNIVVTGGTAGCRHDNLRRRQ